MILTAAEPRRKNRTALFLDGESAVAIDTVTYAESGLRPGDELTDERLHELIEESNARIAQEKALYLLEHRAYSQRELTDRVSRVASREAAERAARRLAEIGLINDAEYARHLAATLFGRKGYSSSRVLFELGRKGIDKSLAEQVVAEAAPDAVGKIREILGRKYAHALHDEKGRQRTVAALRRLGYRWDDIRTAMRQFLDEDDFNDEGSGTDD